MLTAGFFGFAAALFFGAPGRAYQKQTPMEIPSAFVSLGAMALLDVRHFRDSAVRIA